MSLENKYERNADFNGIEHKNKSRNLKFQFHVYLFCFAP